MSVTAERVHPRMSLEPLSDRVIIHPRKDEDKTPGGIIIPPTVNKDKPVAGKIVAVGPGRMTDDGKRIPLSVKVNDEVFYSKYAGVELKVEGEEFLIISETEILAIHRGK